MRVTALLFAAFLGLVGAIPSVAQDYPELPAPYRLPDDVPPEARTGLEDAMLPELSDVILSTAAPMRRVAAVHEWTGRIKSPADIQATIDLLEDVRVSTTDTGRTFILYRLLAPLRGAVIQTALRNPDDPVWLPLWDQLTLLRDSLLVDEDKALASYAERFVELPGGADWEAVRRDTLTCLERSESPARS
jgi:hypothetical protein